MADDTITFTGNAEGLIREYQKLEKEIEKLNQKLADGVKTSSAASREEQKRLGEAARLTKENETALERYNRKLSEMKRHFDAGRISQETMTRGAAKLRDELRGTSTGWEGVASKGKTAAAAIGVAFTSVMATILKAMADMEAKFDRIAKTNVDFNASMEGLRMNFVPDTTVGKADLDREIQGIATRTGVNVDDVAGVATLAFAAKGEKSNRHALSGTEAALEITKNPQAAGGLASAIGDFMKFEESQDTRAIGGFLMQGQQQSRIAKLEGFAKNAQAAVRAGKERGLNVEQGVEFYSALTQLGGDKEGDMSRTAFIALMDELGKDTSMQGNAADKLQQLWADPKKAEAFAKGLSVEKAMAPAVRSLVRGDAQARSALSQTQANIGSMLPTSDAANRLAFDENKAFVQGQFTPAGILADEERRTRANVEEFRLREAKIEGAVAELRQTYEKTLDEINIPGGPDEFRKRSLLFAIDDVSLHPQRRGTDDRVQATAAATIGDLEYFKKSSVTQAPETQEFLNKQIAVLEQIRDRIGQLDQNNKADAQKQLEAEQRNRPAAPSPMNNLNRGAGP